MLPEKVLDTVKIHFQGAFTIITLLSSPKRYFYFGCAPTDHLHNRALLWSILFTTLSSIIYVTAISLFCLFCFIKKLYYCIFIMFIIFYALYLVEIMFVSVSYNVASMLICLLLSHHFYSMRVCLTLCRIVYFLGYNLLLLSYLSFH